MRPELEVADIFRTAGPAWRDEQRGHLSLAQLKVMSAIEQCRSASLGGHVLRCTACDQPQIAYNSCLVGSLPLRGARTNVPASYGGCLIAPLQQQLTITAGPWIP
jgi:hypothetical protein